MDEAFHTPNCLSPNYSRGQSKEADKHSSTPLVSVCLPVYNAALHLWDCLDSILSQSFKDFELLIADDQSTDASIRVIETYHDSRIKLFRREHDYIGTCNFLLDQARGKYIARMDADDTMCPGRLQKQIQYLEAHPDVAILGGGMNIMGQPPHSDIHMPLAYDVTPEMFATGTSIAHPTVMMRREALQTNHLRYDHAYIYAEDYNLWADAIIAGLRIVNLSDSLINYRVSETQVSQKHRTEQAVNAQKVQRKIAQFLYPETEIIGMEGTDIVSTPVAKGNQLTLIIPFLNEGDEVAATLRSIRETADDAVEIIVINDGSDDGRDYASEVMPFRVCYVYNRERKGVAACRDLGVSLCQTPYFLLLDAHMRFYDKVWFKRLVNLIKEDERVLLCCQTRFLNKDQSGCVTVSTQCPTTYGALTPFKPGCLWPDIDWNYHEQYPGEDTEPIACVLGAGYAASKRYWEYLHGLQGLKYYGSDEALISFKVWLEGGRCLLVKDVVIGHIYRDKAPYKHHEEETYNNMLIAHLLLPQSWRCRCEAMVYDKDKSLYLRSQLYLSRQKLFIEGQRDYLSSIRNVSFEEVLQLHKARSFSASDMQQQERVLAEVNDFVMAHPVANTGLYEGQAGQLLWLSLYARDHEMEAITSRIAQLWSDVERAIANHSLSWNFAQGVSGIGWAIIYLNCYGLLEEDAECVLPEIDRQLQDIALDRVLGRLIDNGAGGILAYAAMRLKTGKPLWGQAYLYSLQEAARRIITDSADLPSIYYAILYLDIIERGTEQEDFRPRISEWLRIGQHLPIDRKLWKPILADGCIGAVINFLNMNRQDITIVA